MQELVQPKTISHAPKAILGPFILVLSLTVGALELNKALLDYIQTRFGEAAAQRLIDWETLANSTSVSEELEKLQVVNDFFNQAKFVADQEQWGREDYWATPVELLAANAGDCEDYSIAKYFTLKEMGVSEEKLKITYVKALKLNQAHMVLAYYETPEAEPLILDNLDKSIKPATQRPDLLPVYSFNGEGLWLSRFTGSKNKRIGSSDKLENWMNMLERQKKLIR